MFALINTGIHTLMYGYYALAALGPRVRPYLRWKRYLTVLQIAQFVICGTYGCLLYYKQTGYPMDWFYCVVGQNPLFFVMFYNFYQKSYTGNKYQIKKCNLDTYVYGNLFSKYVDIVGNIERQKVNPTKSENGQKVAYNQYNILFTTVDFTVKHSYLQDLYI